MAQDTILRRVDPIRIIIEIDDFVTLGSELRAEFIFNRQDGVLFLAGIEDYAKPPELLPV